MKPASPPEAAGTDAWDRTTGQPRISGRKRARFLSGPGLASALIGTRKRRFLLGVLLLGLVAVGGAYFAYRPGPTPLDRLAFAIVPLEYSRHSLTYIADLGRPRVVAPGVVICAFIAFFWDRRRAITCLAAPAAAIIITEYLAKPAVGRTFGGTLCYPSGHMTAVASLICAFVVAVPARWRKAAGALGVVVGIVVAITLLLLRWHYLTDVIAAVLLSMATTLIVDATLHSRTFRWS